jgi:hypothetical protein
MRKLLLLLLLLGGLAPLSAEAYPWMIRHGYTSCATCHVDPSGGGMLTSYGRAQSEVLVAVPNGKRVEAGEASPSTGFFFGALELPEWFNLASPSEAEPCSPRPEAPRRCAPCRWRRISAPR